MNGQVILGMLLNVVIAAVAGLAVAPVLGIVMGLFWVMALFGMILSALGSPKHGAHLILVGCLPFAPIGLIGVLGARKILDEVAQREFSARRAASE
jgi:hypothetical protein